MPAPTLTPSGGGKRNKPKTLQYSSVEQLNNQIGDMKSKAQGKQARMLLQTTNSLFKQAKENEASGDEEKAYLLYMRYMDLRKIIKNKGDYSRDQVYYDSLLSQKDAKVAVESCERIVKSLQGRYHEAAMKKTNGTPAQNEFASRVPLGKVTQNFQSLKISEDTTSTIIPEAIEPTYLYKKLMQEKSTTFLVLDVREKSEFNSSRLKHSNVINVPSEQLSPGMTAVEIERILSIEVKAQWKRRAGIDVIIMMDWESETFEASQKLKIIKDAMFKWDANGGPYKSRPHLLKGGFYNFVMHYPTEVVNPHTAREYVPKKRNNSTGVKNALMEIQDLEYPDLGAAFIATPASTPSNSLTSLQSAVTTAPATFTNAFTTTSKPTTTTTSVNGNSSYLNSTSSSSGSLYPTSVVSDLSSDLNRAFVSGAITVKKDTNRPASPSTFLPPPSAKVRPGVPDRSTKPSVCETKPTSSYNDTVRHLLANPNPPVPKIDRSLKARMILKTQTEKTTDLGQVIDAESDLVEESIDLEKKTEELEDRWTILRLKREKAAEEDMKLELIQNEDKLLEEMHKLETEKQVKDRENATLRNELTKLKAQLSQEQRGKEILEARESERRIALEAKERERIKMAEQVEEKRRARKQKQREQAQVGEGRLKLQQSEEKRQEVDRQLQERERQLARNKERLPRASPLRVTRVPNRMDEEEEPATFGGGLSRSYSSPNIAKMLGDEDDRDFSPVGNMVPRFDRSYKPKPAPPSHAPSSIASSGSRQFVPSQQEAEWERNMARLRDFQGIESSSRRCLTGLKNLGNTCYMNSILQCLANFQLVVDYATRRDCLLRDLNKTSKTGGNVAIEFSQVLKNLTSGQFNSIQPTDFKAVIGKYDREFRTFDQQDAHELLNKMIEWLHDDLNEVENADESIKRLPEQKNEGVPEVEAAEKAWETDKTVGKSFFKEIFYGQWRSILACPCGWNSVKYESFFELALQLPPGNGKTSLRNCIENYLKTEDDVTYKCPKCNVNREMTKKFEIVRLPKIIIIQLVRFYNDGFSRKRQNAVDFELDNLNLGVYAKACQGKLNRYQNYKLHSVCNHMGSMEGGHYTAYCNVRGSGNWYKYDDHEVVDIHPRDVVTPKAYILFYQATNN